MMWSSFSFFLGTFWVSSLVMCQSLWPIFFFIKLFVFLLLSFINSSYLWNSSPLKDVRFAYIFPQCVACLLMLLTLSLSERSFLILMRSSLSVIYFMDCVFVVVSKKKKKHHTQIIQVFLLCYLLGVWKFCIYI